MWFNTFKVRFLFLYKINMAIDLLCPSPKLSYSCKLIKYVPFPINHRPNSLQEVWSFEGDVLLLDISGEIIKQRYIQILT